MIPSHNPDAFFVDTLDSVERNDYENIELVLFNNASENGIFESTIRDRTFKSVRKVHVARSETKLSLGQSWSKACEIATGKYLVLLPSDDVLYRHSITLMVNALEANTNACFAFGKSMIIDKKGRRILPLLSLKKKKPSIKKLTSKSLLKRVKRRGRNFVSGTASVMFRRDLLKENLPWNSEIPYLTDLDLYVRMLSTATYVLEMNSFISKFRIHGGSITFDAMSKSRNETKRFYALYLLQNSPQVMKLLINLRITINTYIRLLLQSIVR